MGLQSYLPMDDEDDYEYRASRFFKMQNDDHDNDDPIQNDATQNDDYDDDDPIQNDETQNDHYDVDD